MDNQYRLLQNYYNSQGVFFNTGNVANLPQPANNPWNGYLPFNNNHSDYVFPSSAAVYRQSVLASSVNGVFVNNMDGDAHTMAGNDQRLTLAGNTYHPYLPSLANSIAGLAGDNNQTAMERCPNSWTAGYGTGTDCVGFAQRSAGYNGNPYKWGELPERLWGQARAGTYYPAINSFSWQITRRTMRIGNDCPNLDRVVPGDIFFYYAAGENGTNIRTGQHIAIVLSVGYNDQINKVTEPVQIKLIESTFTWNSVIGSVINIRTLNSYWDNNWFLVRLEVN